MLIDLHNHALPCSTDSSVSVDDLIREAASLGVDAIAITDHGEGTDFEYADSIAHERGLVLVPGREIVCEFGHALVLSTDTTWLRELSERCGLPVPRGALAPVAVVWAHPAGWHVAGMTIDPDPGCPSATYVHAVEVLNGARLWQAGGVERAAQVRDALGVGATGGSDSHGPRSIGRCLTRIDGVTDSASIIDAIIEGRTSAELGSAWARAHDHVYERADLVRYLQPVIDSGAENERT